MLRKKYVNQAIVVADSFNRRFYPITAEIPRALMPLVNAPLIDYTIELLASAGIELIYVVCVAHAEQVQEHLRNSSFTVTVKPLALSVSTVGEVLRRVHDLNIIDSDFVLVHGDLVGHLKLDEVLFQHRLRKEKDNTVLMTTVYKRGTPTHASRSLEDDTVVGLSAEGEILFWENQPTSSIVEVDPMIIVNQVRKGSIQLHYDLIDTHVDICSSEVLQLFKENFDYHTLRLDFMNSVLQDDVTQHRVFAHIVNEYAARVKDLRTYASVSRDVIHRWCAPVVVENPLLVATASFRLNRGLIYRERNVRRHPTAKTGPHTVLGSGSSVGAKSVVSKTVVGRNCKIGKNCTITNSFLWPGVVVDDNCIIDWSVVCSSAHIHEGVTISKGCVISFGVHVGPNVQIKSHSRLTREHIAPHKLGLAEDEEVTVNIDLGDKGKGVLWVLKEDDANNVLHVSSGGRMIHEIVADSEDEDSDEMQGAGQPDDDSSSDVPLSGFTDFEVEVREIILDGIKSNSSIEDIVVAVNGRKFAHDKTFFECAKCVVWALLACLPENMAQKALLLEFQKLLKRWKPMLEKFIQSQQDQSELLWTIQEYMDREFSYCTPIFQFIVHALYDADILEEDAIWAWEKEQQELQGPDRKFLEQCGKFLKWLKEADSDEDDE